MIQIKNLEKTFIVKKRDGFLKSKKTEVKAIDGINITIKKGEITGLLGINGAGKTTTAKVLSTLIEPSSGTVTIDGLDYGKNEKVIKQKINMIAGGERMIYFRLTAKENLTYFGKMYGLKSNELKQRIDYLLKKVGLHEKSDIPVETFSKGMKQRLQIARGLINNPDYIFLDEPTLGLDIQIAKEIREIFKEMASTQNKGILLTSHYIKEVEELCDYLYIMHEGKIIKEGTPTFISEISGGDLENAILKISNDITRKVV